MEKIVLNDLTFNDDALTKEDSPQPVYAEDQVGPESEVTLHFELSLPDGEIIDSNFSGNPASFRIGDGSLLPGFEQALFGMRAGEERTFRLGAASAFGERNANNIQSFPRYRFPADLAMEKGVMINFADAAGYEQAGVITDFNSASVEVDFNHPLAGREITFRASIVALNCLNCLN